MTPPCVMSEDDRQFLRAFEELQLPPGEFRHAAHVRAAWCALQAEGDLAAGAARFLTAFRRYVAHIGATAKYHETISWFYLVVIFERLADAPSANWEQFCAANSDLLDSAMPALRQRYRAETLESPLARRTFLLPEQAAAG